MRNIVDPIDSEGLAVVFEAEFPRLWRSVFAYAQDRALTDDAVAEAFAQCLRRGEAVRDPKAWVWKAAFRLAAGELQDRRRVASIEDVPERAESGDIGVILAALSVLPGNQRAASVLHWYAGYSIAEIADLLHISRATVRVHLSRSRKRLRPMLEGGASS